MTQMDLRIAFKMDTGKYPLWTKNHDGQNVNSRLFPDKFTFIKGVPSSLYGRWLEEKIGSPKELRNRYYRETKEEPTWYHFSKARRRDQDGGPLRIEYSLWLEDLALQE